MSVRRTATVIYAFPCWYRFIVALLAAMVVGLVLHVHVLRDADWFDAYLSIDRWMKANFIGFFAPEWSVRIARYVAPATYFAIGAVASIPVYALLSRDRRRLDHYTRCGRCDYILKGLTEPRCPECGLRL